MVGAAGNPPPRRSSSPATRRGSSDIYTAAWQARFTENLPGANPPDAPLFLYHGLFDEIVPRGQAATLRDTYCYAGADVRWDWHRRGRTVPERPAP